jgi:DNA-3-methyladenine glycosylase
MAARRRQGGRKLRLAFYRRPAADVAPDLIGKILVRRLPDGTTRRARIVETEAYSGPADLASHASRGLTRRTTHLFGHPGRAYVYFVYGMHDMFNIVTGAHGGGEAVLVRAAEPLDGWDASLSGPAKLARALGITRADDGADLGGTELYLLDPGDPPPKIKRTRRIGIDYARHWKDALLRFIDAQSRAISKPRWGR